MSLPRRDSATIMQGVCTQFKIILLALLFATPAARSQDLHILTDAHSPPVVMYEGSQVVGLATSVLQEALKRSKTSYDVTVMPWLRAYDIALRRAGRCIYPTDFTQQRASLFKWVGPLIHDSWVIFAPVDGPGKIATIDELKNYRVAAYQGTAQTKYLESQGIKVETINAFDADILNIEKVLNKRADLWAANRLLGKYLAGPASKFHLKEVMSLGDVDSYMACNKDVPDSQIAAWNSTIQDMNKDGTFARIIGEDKP